MVVREALSVANNNEDKQGLVWGIIIIVRIIIKEKNTCILVAYMYGDNYVNIKIRSAINIFMTSP